MIILIMIWFDYDSCLYLMIWFDSGPKIKSNQIIWHTEQGQALVDFGGFRQLL
jgi:hypothetical protein